MKMQPNDERYQYYLDILSEELIPAMGCTEPIAIAYASARARDLLGMEPQRVLVEVSSNIIKNVKSVVVPNTGRLKGIEAAVAAGIVAGRADKVLEVIADVSVPQQETIRDFLASTEISVSEAPSDLSFDLIVTVAAGDEQASVRISNFHTNIVLMTRNHEILYRNQDCDDVATTGQTDRSHMNVVDILAFAGSVPLHQVADLLQRQIDDNMAIAREGLSGDWGANIGSVLMDVSGDDIRTRAKALAAAGSDARMSGCSLPVVIVSGSGNQGITASVPVIEYARDLGVSRETLLRALLVSNLVSIHLKTGIGQLSAYCGAICAGCGAGAGIAWLHGGRYEEVAHTIVNALAIISGMICDGAKPSCAAKISTAVDAGLLGYEMFARGQQFYGGEGIVEKGVENTIRNIGRLGRDGMRETDREIIRMMLGK